MIPNIPMLRNGQRGQACDLRISISSQLLLRNIYRTAVGRESQIADEVDTYGNWIKQTKWITDAHGRRPVKVTYRKIT